ncbi:5-formyltetrahydrofolate cyclo-ligase [Psychromonas sp. CNPT3]|uniref:5-formyltetrahydrofolate cyclo-ligase n=1 Tax=Psychromonas sp. CNPT3 TaxID=314282 RepID=UPI00006E78E2|nr:5-formyltetrahydrofolate cyclo-ligase [Psychromonas sp. CNPT3]AGH82091.1 5-formyltetrahydrofolate cyclo-ligase [Psychromonas sp. CNPT3]
MISATTIRLDMRRARNALSPFQQQNNAAQLLNRLQKNPRILRAKKIALSLTHDAEIDTLPFIHWCWENGKKVYLPVIHPFSPKHLLFLEYQRHTPLQLNRYRIAEPQLNVLTICPFSQLDIVFTPLVAFDKQGRRLGMGGGFYDRMLSPWLKNKTGPYPIGLAHDCQRIDTLPTNPWDVPQAEIFTPSAHYQFNNVS